MIYDFLVSDRIIFGTNIVQYGCESLIWENNDDLIKRLDIGSTVGLKPTTTQLISGALPTELNSRSIQLYLPYLSV